MEFEADILTSLLIDALFNFVTFFLQMPNYISLPCFLGDGNNW
jgi:hypothetical protein